jgi:hypothetical protein
MANEFASRSCLPCRAATAATSLAIEVRQSTTVPKTSKTHALMVGASVASALGRGKAGTVR